MLPEQGPDVGVRMNVLRILVRARIGQFNWLMALFQEDGEGKLRETEASRNEKLCLSSEFH